MAGSVSAGHAWVRSNVGASWQTRNPVLPFAYSLGTVNESLVTARVTDISGAAPHQENPELASMKSEVLRLKKIARSSAVLFDLHGVASKPSRQYSGLQFDGTILKS